MIIWFEKAYGAHRITVVYTDLKKPIKDTKIICPFSVNEYRNKMEVIKLCELFLLETCMKYPISESSNPKA